MNICLLTYEWPPVGGGIATYMYNLARGLLAVGHRVVVITHNEKPLTIPGIEIYPVTYNNNTGFIEGRLKRKIGKTFFGVKSPWSRAAYNLFEESGLNTEIDIIETAEYGAWGINFINNPFTPVVVRCHAPAHVVWDASLPEFEKKWPSPNSIKKQDSLERNQAFKADGIISPSRALAYHLSLNWTIPLKRFNVIPNPIDTEFFKPTVDDQRKKEILYVGRLEFNKGVFDLAKAIVPVLKKFPKINIRFVGMDRPTFGKMVQYGDSSVKAISSIIGEQLSTRVNFTDHVSVDKIVELQNKALLSVVPALGFESFSYTVLESMACGTPVIATNCGGPAEIITHGVDGLLIEPGQPKVLSQSILEIIDNQTLRKKLANNARQTVLGKFSFSVLVPQIMKVYENVINRWPGE